MSVIVELPVDSQNKTSILSGHLTTILIKTKTKDQVRSDKIYFTVLQYLLVNPESKKV